MAAPGTNTPFTLVNAMLNCGITDAVLFDCNTKSSRIATEQFYGNFTLCMDKTYVELDDDLKLYSTLTAAHGQIRLTPDHKKNIEALIQCTRDHIRFGIYPFTVRLWVANASNFIKRYKHNDTYVKISKKIIETPESENYTDILKWIEWYPTFMKFLHTILGRNLTPLSYICRPVSTIVPTTGYGDFIDEYVDKSPLTGQSHLTNAAEVHT